MFKGSAACCHYRNVYTWVKVGMLSLFSASAYKQEAGMERNGQSERDAETGEGRERVREAKTGTEAE